MSPGVDVRVVELARADLGDPGAVGRVLQRAAPLADDDEGERSQTIGRRGRPGESDPVAEDLGIQRGGRVGRRAVQSGQGVGQIGGDRQALAIEVSAPPGDRSAPGSGPGPPAPRPGAGRGLSSDQAAWSSGDSGSTSRLQASTAARAATSRPPARAVS